MNKTYQNLNVLEFYKNLPFNIYSDIDYSVKNIKKNNPTEFYPPLKDIIKNNTEFNLLDLGCGVGWLSNSLSFYYNKINVTGVDFNPVAINYANQVKNKLKLKTSFIIEDLFKVNFKFKFNIICSIGVLHHTNNCLEGIKKIVSLFPEYFVIGLYHKYGRKPFLDHFENLKLKYQNLKRDELENILYKEYKKLDTRFVEETHLLSWFKDQVLHPHETQHTLSEILPIIKEKYEIISTSLSKFQKIENLSKILETEAQMYDVGLKKLKQNKYFPGFFIFVAKKNKNN